MASPTKLARDNTMEATAKEGIEFLEKNSPALAEQCKKVATETAENGSGDATEPIKNGNSPTKLARDNTMVVTAQEGKEFVEKQGGVNEDAKTRAQDADLKSSDEDKTATKRSAEETNEPEVEEAKKQKTEDDDEQKEEKVDANGEGEEDQKEKE
ncbi:uncharacterized protein LOC143449785 [Clavelina lepadiformis]|uniref:uncharacterized protein LOC143449785 n=1 Tax=Clavelina lepadiformis TaxID=159417 RepID=UPI0040422771